MEVCQTADTNNNQGHDISNLRNNKQFLKISSGAIMVPHGGWEKGLPRKDVSSADGGENQGIGFELSPFSAAGCPCRDSEFTLAAQAVTQRQGC